MRTIDGSNEPGYLADARGLMDDSSNFEVDANGNEDRKVQVRSPHSQWYPLPIVKQGLNRIGKKGAKGRSLNRNGKLIRMAIWDDAGKRAKKYGKKYGGMKKGGKRSQDRQEERTGREKGAKEEERQDTCKKICNKK